SDPYGLYTGFVVPEHLRKTRWTLYLGSSRRWLPKILADTGKIDLFISDSANIYTQQRYEFRRIYPQLVTGGAAVFNNISWEFKGFISAMKEIQVHSIWQEEKPSCITALILKSPLTSL